MYSFILSLFFLTIYPNPGWVRKPENPEKTHDVRQSVDQLFPHVIKCPNTGFELLTSEVGGSRSDDSDDHVHNCDLMETQKIKEAWLVLYREHS